MNKNMEKQKKKNWKNVEFEILGKKIEGVKPAVYKEKVEKTPKLK